MTTLSTIPQTKIQESLFVKPIFSKDKKEFLLKYLQKKNAEEK
jgi:hypothetical protein